MKGNSFLLLSVKVLLSQQKHKKVMKNIQSVDRLKQIKSAIIEMKTISELIERFSK